MPRKQFRLSRRDVFINAAMMCLSIGRSAKAAHPGITVGAIRWDPWYDPDAGGPREAVARSLAPIAFHGRAPSCATVAADGTVSFGRCDTQAQMDAEIGAAHRAGLDYWAYCWYGAGHGMQEAWRLHQASLIFAQLNWCLMFSSFRLFRTEVQSAGAPAVVSLLAQPNYQHVTVGRDRRPLVFLLDAASGMETAADAIASLRARCTAAGVGVPYVVVLGAKAVRTPGGAAAEGADAAGLYTVGHESNRDPYRKLTEATEAYWTAMAATGQPVVPTAMTGWDRRPRIQTPVPWEASNAPGRPENYVEPGTPEQIASHVAAMVAWVRAHRDACPAQTGLVYSWDEHDEGGSCLSPSIAGGDAILAAVGRVL